ncbi:MAG: ATP-binding cassette domain-containing protein [Candidatus Odinarchaeota archaeon]|nr:ATP-binding cassette domain-containing protein [Candidatus Odinarchaeota archaeon]
MSVEFRDFSFTYLGRKKPALKNINLKINKGESVAIIGPIGAGKSTLLKALNGLVPYEFPGKREGELYINGIDVSKKTISELAQHVGIVLENPATQTFALTVMEDVAFGPSNLGLDKEEILRRVDFALEATRLKGLERRNPNELSGGQQQSLAIAGIMAMQPDIIALDEPLSMLDPVGKYQVLEVIKSITKQRNMTLIITESGPDIEVIPYFVNRVILMNNGEVLLDGPTDEVLSNELVEKVGVKLPQVTDLAFEMRKRISPNIKVPVTLEEAIEILRSLGMNSNNIKVTEKFKNKIDSELKSYKSIITSTEKPAILVKNLSFTYEGGVQALKDISLKIMPGEMVGLIGQNGSGKTTLALNIVGLLKSNDPNSVVLVDGLDVKTTPLKQIITHVNYVFQNPDNQLFSKTVYEEMAYGPKMLGFPEDVIESRIDEMLKLFGLEDYKEDYIIGLPRNIKTILAIASIFTIKPKHIIIDEPTTGLDSESSKRVMEVLKHLNQQGHTIIIITHDMKLVAEFCKRVIVMYEGRILLDGPTRLVFSRKDVLEKAFIKPPQIAQLGFQFLGDSDNIAILTIEEMIEFIEANLGRVS